ncbi:Os12g0518400 [Oryza sativa Japonica Group]|uniref:Os12g0518400 protein n=1 Tax=Oryza sativa subsp. japonica TaxID=39947 RepID=C7J9Z6_ORYSJ|nr:Os12g0518400 [Oryza sativa Japonica Group]|eukprot:NP_001176983.1 Os12g0518400 [Oryza sativa Japonica Group]
MEDQAWLPIRDAALLPLHLRFPHQCRGPPSATIVTVDMPRKRMAEAICMLHELKLLSVSGTGWILLVKVYEPRKHPRSIRSSHTVSIGPEIFHLWHTFSKSGGLKWLERSISASLWEPTAYTSGFISESSTSDLDAEFEALSMSMVGTRSLFASSSPPLVGSTHYLSALLPGWYLCRLDVHISKGLSVGEDGQAARKGIPGNGFHDIGINMTLGSPYDICNAGISTRAFGNEL